MWKGTSELFVLVCFGYCKGGQWLTMEKNGGFEYLISADKVCTQGEERPR